MTTPATTQELIADVLIHHMNDDDAYTAADALSRDPAITVRPRRIITGEWRDVETALDDLPRGTIIRWQEDVITYVAIKEINMGNGMRWYEAGYRQPRDSESIARDNTPIEVIA